MRIGIVTQPLKSNYGGVLQNYALQQVLGKLGHRPVTIDYIPTIPLGKWLKINIKTLLHYCTLDFGRKFYPFPRAKRGTSVLDGFVVRHIERTEPVRRYSPSLVSSYALDGVIAGSDQVWRPRYNVYIEDSFLRFVEDRKCLKVAYAASFGVDSWEFSQKQTAECRKLAARFDAVSVRECSGVQLCRKYFGVDAEEVLDPTLLLDAEHYSALCNTVPSSENASLVAYLLDPTDRIKEQIDRIAVQKSLKVRYVQAGEGADYTVEQWLAMFRDASWVITDSFHGTVFSILNHKPFAVLVNEGRGADRFHSLLGKFGLQDRMVAEVSDAETLGSIDWTRVDAELDEWRSRSMDFLANSLKGK